LLGIITLLVCGFSVAPVLVVVIESFTTSDYVVFPPPGLGLKWYHEFANRPEFIDSVLVSAITALCASVSATLLGLAASFALLRHNLPGRSLLRALFMAPLSLPGLVLGLALLQMLARNGIPRGVLTMVLAHVLITTPFAIRFVTVALSGVDPRIEQAAASLGATRLVVFRQVTLPLIRPGLVAALVFAFIISFDEVAASLFVASPDAMTLPVRIFVYVEQNYDPLVTAVSSLLVLAAMVALIVVERLIGVGRVFGLR
jgi:putative spermidine/putrescine transport system permease protein